MHVPCSLSAKLLSVTIEPYHIRVQNKITQQVYLEGELERGVVPEECVWTYGGGEGEDGCLLVLSKMNLELYER